MGCYWAFVVLLTGAVVFFGIGQDGGLGGGIIAVLLLLPLVQLVASILTLIWINIRSKTFPDKRAGLLILGKITLYSFLGALAGVVAMIFGFKLFS